MEKKTNRHTNLFFNALIYIVCAMAFYGCSKEGSNVLTPEELSVRKDSTLKNTGGFQSRTME
jgi:hypothetical protein